MLEILYSFSNLFTQPATQTYLSVESCGQAGNAIARVAPFKEQRCVQLNGLKQLPRVILELPESDVGNSVSVQKKYEAILL